MTAQLKDAGSSLANLAPEARASQLLSFDATKAELTNLAKQSERITQITDKAGRDECHSSLMVLKSTRVDIEKRGKEARDDANKFAKAVIAKEKELIEIITPEEQRLQLLRDQWDSAIERERLEKLEAERLRVEAIQRKIQTIRDVPGSLVGKPSVIIAGQLAKLRETVLDEDELGADYVTATDALTAAVARVEQLLAAQQEADAEKKRQAERDAEMEAMRKQQAEMQAKLDQAEADRVERERKAAAEEAARIARELAEKRAAEIEAQRKIDEAARLEREAQEKAEREAREESDRIERERIAAERAEQQSALDAERVRQAAEQKKLDEQAAKLKREQQAAKAEAERARLAGLGLREAVEAVITYFGAKPDAPQCVLDLQAALVNDIRASATAANPARAKRAKG